MLSVVQMIERMIPAEESPLPRIGVILGSGLSGAADRLRQRGFRVSYDQIPGMPIPRVLGHPGLLVGGRIGDHLILMLQGRVHRYEGYSMSEVTFGTELLCRLGISQLIVTNAAGGIHERFQPGNLMLIDGHLTLPDVAAGCYSVSQRVPMQNINGLCGRRPRIWCGGMRALAAALPTPLSVHSGVYAMLSGPCYETPAEIRMLRLLGADAVGMSTVPEALLASALGVSVLGVSCITNLAAGLTEQKLNHAEVTSTAASIGEAFTDWLWRMLEQFRPNS